MLLYIVKYENMLTVPYTIWEIKEKYEHNAGGNDGKTIFSPHKTEISNKEPTIKYYTTQMKVNMKKTHVHTYLKTTLQAEFPSGEQMQ